MNTRSCSVSLLMILVFFGLFFSVPSVIAEDTPDTMTVQLTPKIDCNQCERQNPQGVCVPDNLKPCDDGNPCTFDDLCFGRVCKGKKDPSPIDPSCRECNPCERLNPQGKCVPDNHKPCDDGDSCTVDDRCLGRVCRGKKDPGCKPPKW